MKKVTLLLAMMYVIINKSVGQEIDSNPNTQTDSTIILLAKKDYDKDLAIYDVKKFKSVCQCGNIVTQVIYAHKIKDKDKTKEINVLLLNLYHKDSRAKIFFSYPDIIESNWRAIDYTQKEGQQNEYFEVNNSGDIEVRQENRKYVMLCLKKLLKLNDSESQ
jgi:hypothetical protein